MKIHQNIFAYIGDTDMIDTKILNAIKRIIKNVSKGYKRKTQVPDIAVMNKKTCVCFVIMTKGDPNIVSVNSKYKHILGDNLCEFYKHDCTLCPYSDVFGRCHYYDDFFNELKKK